MSQKLQILSHLKRRPITALQALRDFGCLRLAARVQELRDQGHKISTTMVHRAGKRVAQYRMEA